MKRLIVTILLVLLIPLQVVGEEARIITAAGDPWPPFVDPQNPQEGLSLEVIRAAFKTQGFEVKYIDVPWARAENGVKKGIYDILPDVWITESRKKELMFSTPYTSNEVKFIALKDDPFEYDEMSSLQGKVVGTIRGYPVLYFGSCHLCSWLTAELSGPQHPVGVFHDLPSAETARLGSLMRGFTSRQQEVSK